jgi:hypothetical protein
MTLPQTVKLGRRNLVLHFDDAYDPSQARDPDGKWTEAGGSAKSAPKKCPADQNTCLVWSIAHAIGKPVDEVWQHAKPFWNKNTGISGAAKDDVLEKLGFELGTVRRDLMYREGDRSHRTLKEAYDLLAKEPKHKRFLITADYQKGLNHMIGYTNGKPLDTAGLKPGREVKLIYEIDKASTHDDYDPTESRDPTGKWTAGGGSSKKQPERKQTTSFVSPNEDPNNLSFGEAVSGLKTKRQKLLSAISHSIDSDLGINDIRINNVVGAWSDGAENSVMTNSASTDPDIEEAAAAMKGYLANQKAVLLFHPDDDGHQFLAQFRIPNNDLADIHQKLLDNGVVFHTLEPRGNDTLIHFYGESEDDLHLFSDAAKQFDQKIKVTRGHGKFIPPEVKEDGTDAEQRAASREAYLQTIRRVGDTGKLRSGFESKWQNHIDNWERETGERIGGGQRSRDAYDPSEARDPDGKWTEGSGGSKPDIQSRGERGRESRGSGETGTGSPEEAQRRAKEVASEHLNLEGLLPSKPMPIAGHGYYVPGPNAQVKETAENYMRSAGLPYNPPRVYNSIDKERATRIARAFDEMEHAPNDPKVKAAYKALAKETLAQWQAVKKTGLKVEWIKPGQDDPYAITPRLAQMDVNDNNHWWGFPTDLGYGTDDPTERGNNPLLEMTDEVIDGHKCCINDIFRIVHDYFGHFKEGVGFRASGEENAWRSHASMYSQEALPAVTSETRGQNSWVNYGPYGESNQKANAAETHYSDQKIGIMPEWTWQEGLADQDKKTTDAYNPAEKRDPGGKWTKGGGGGSTKQKPWIQELKEKEKNRPGVVTRAAHGAVYGAAHILGEFSKEDYEILRHHLAPHSATRHKYASRILKIATLLPRLLQMHLKEEYHKFKNAGGALKAMATGKRPTAKQWKGLRQAATTVLLTSAVFMLTGDPTGGHVAQAATHAATQVGGHGAAQVAAHGAAQVAGHAAEHTAGAAAAHLAAEFGHELATHTVYEHASKFGIGMLRLALSAAVGAGVTHLNRRHEEDTNDALPDDSNTPIDANEMKLLQDYLQTLANVVIKHPIPDKALYDSLPDQKDNKTKDEYDPSEKRDESGKWTAGGGSSKHKQEEDDEPDDYEEPAYSDPSERIAPEYHEPQPTPAKPSDNFKPPKKTVKAYKLFETKPDQPGKLFPLFIDSSTSVPIGEWIPGKPVPTKSFAPRPGWHAGELPLAPHLRDSATHTKIAPSRVWAEVEMPDDEDWQSKADKNGRMSKATKKSPSHWIAGEIKDQVPHGGHYKFNTKPGQGGTWLIGGAIRVKKVLSDKEVHDILTKAGKPEDAKHETNRSEPYPYKPAKTKDSRWRFLHVHTVDRIFRIRLKDAEYDPAKHPHAPEGAPAGKGGQFVSKGSKPSGGNTAASPAKKQATEKAANTKPDTTKTTKAANTGTNTTSKPDTTQPLKGSKGHTGLVSTIAPADVRAADEYQQPNFEYMRKTDEKQLKTNIAVFDNPVMYPLPAETFHGTDEEMYKKIINHIKSNLRFVYNNTPKEERDRTKQWYAGARKMVDRQVEKYKEYNIKDTTVAGLYATLSPINLWDQNVRQADQMIDIYLKQQDSVWDKDMDKLLELPTWKSGEMKQLADLARGKTLKDIKDVTVNGKVISAARIKGHWIRAYDMAHFTNADWNGKPLDYQPFHAITPEGDYKEWYMTDAGKPQKFSWHTPDFMEKAVKILDADGDRNVISDNLGEKHKVRSFYNNILDPDSDNNDVTMDTHAIDAAWIMDAPAAVYHNFGNAPPEGKIPYGWERGAAGSVKSGVEGTYGFYADAYRQLAKELGIRPRELQSIVWETKRKWMGNMTPSELSKVANLWKLYQEGRIPGGIEETQKRVKALIDQSPKDREARKNATPEKPYRYRSRPIWNPGETNPYEYAFMPPKAKKPKKGEAKPEQPKPEEPKPTFQLPKSSDPDPYDEYEIYRAEMEAKKTKKPKPPLRNQQPAEYEYGS